MRDEEESNNDRNVTSEELSPAERSLHKELVALRAEKGVGLTGGKLANYPLIVRALGGGDPDTSVGAFFQISWRWEEDRRLKAAIMSLGIGTESETVNGRIADVAADFYITERHARRLSDEGLRRVAAIIAGKPLARTMLQVNLVQLGVEMARVSVDLRTHHLRFEGDLPEVWVNGRLAAVDVLNSVRVEDVEILTIFDANLPLRPPEESPRVLDVQVSWMAAWKSPLVSGSIGSLQPNYRCFFNASETLGQVALFHVPA